MLKLFIIFFNVILTKKSYEFGSRVRRRHQLDMVSIDGISRTLITKETSSHHALIDRPCSVVLFHEWNIAFHRSYPRQPQID